LKYTPLLYGTKLYSLIIFYYYQKPHGSPSLYAGVNNVQKNGNMVFGLNTMLKTSYTTSHPLPDKIVLFGTHISCLAASAYITIIIRRVM
jgi:hypothetical protein